MRLQRLWLVRNTPAAKWVHLSPEDIGGMAVYLCSDFAKNITGSSMTVDGGWTAV